jgi:hypothetical protein
LHREPSQKERVSHITPGANPLDATDQTKIVWEGNTILHREPSQKGRVSHIRSVLSIPLDSSICVARLWFVVCG